MKPEANELDQEVRDRLNMILHKTDQELTEEERGFLRSREFYIKDKHKPSFPSVFGKGNEIKQPQAPKEPAGEKNNNENAGDQTANTTEDTQTRDDSLAFPGAVENQVQDDDEDEIEPTL